MSKSKLSPIQRLAEAHGIQTSYINDAGEEKLASEEALRRLLEILGADEEPGTGRLEPVIVAWQGKRAALKLPAESKASLRLEDGTERPLKGNQLPELPLGYHRLNIESKAGEQTALVISAPARLYSEPIRDWGAFLPLYAAHSRDSWGSGNFSDWARLSRWVGQQGGRVIGTLPVLSAFLDYPKIEPSPYSPASRLFWNEFFIDVTAIPEFSQSTAARKAASGLKRALDKFRASEFVDYKAEWTARRKVLAILAREFKDSPRQKEFKAYLKTRPEAEHYARFRAACEKYNASWHVWPERAKKKLGPSDYDESTKESYLYLQWTAQQQVDHTLAACNEAGVKFYLDLPLGVNADAFDVWRYRDFFAQGASVGAPPDSFFTKGQDWGFAPLHPLRARELHYKYFIEYIEFQMRHTGLLRIDHVMGLHRLWWVPHGRPASEGAYVRYPADELYAILSVESHRHKTMLVGENLGTVPPQVNKAMDRHKVRRMYVLQYEQPHKGPLRAPDKSEVASVNTHDMPAFAAHWAAADIDDRTDLGLIPKSEVAKQKKRRVESNRNLITFLRKQKVLRSARPGPRDVLAAILKFLAQSPAEIVLVTLEDLWLEERSQNVPGTSTERKNWQRKSRLTLEELEASQEIADLLRSAMQREKA